jgi:signal transduction histidine kinase
MRRPAARSGREEDMGKEKKANCGIEYVVGAEKRLNDVLSCDEVMPLLKGAVRAGASAAVVRDGHGKVLWASGGTAEESAFSEELPLYLEGEVVGRIALGCEKGDELRVSGLRALLREALQVIANTNLKRMLTTETHTAVVNRSYEELLETNRRLCISEAKYRELAENLDRKVTERTEDLKRAHARLLQQEKLASVGQLAAGVAHEINNPLGFIISNLHTLQRYVARYREMLDFYRTAAGSGAMNEEIRGRLRRKEDELKIAIISSDAEELIGQCLYGAERVRKIVADLKGFSHIDDGGEVPVDVNDEIDKTLNVLLHEVPEDAQIIKDYRPLPALVCTPGLLCQVFLNIVLNALQARRSGLRLVIGTSLEDDRIVIRFSDNGPGISDGIKDRIFEPFYTTKDVGKGTGMGLAVAYEIITAYGGSIEAESLLGEGATFLIRLPAKRGPHVKVL